MLPFKNNIFSNIAIAILYFSLLLPIYLSLLISLLKFLYELWLSLFQLLRQHSCRSFTLLKALAKSNCNIFAIAFKERERATTIAIAIVGIAITLKREPSKKKQRTVTKKDTKRIKSENFTRSNKEKSNIAFTILEKLMIGWHHNYFVFWVGSNNIFADCTLG